MDELTEDEGLEQCWECADKTDDHHAIIMFTGKVREGMSNKAMYISIDMAKRVHNKYK